MPLGVIFGGGSPLGIGVNGLRRVQAENIANDNRRIGIVRQHTVVRARAGVQHQPARKANNDFSQSLHGFTIYCVLRKIQTPPPGKSCKVVEGCWLIIG